MLGSAVATELQRYEIGPLQWRQEVMAVIREQGVGGGSRNFSFESNCYVTATSSGMVTENSTRN
jgi:hypothetical protein